MCFSSPQWLISRVVYYQASESNLTDNVPTGFDNSTDNIAVVTSSQVIFEICLAKQFFMSPDVMWQSALCNIALCLMHCQWTKGIQVWQFSVWFVLSMSSPEAMPAGTMHPDTPWRELWTALPWDIKAEFSCIIKNMFFTSEIDIPLYLKCYWADNQFMRSAVGESLQINPLISLPHVSQGNNLVCCFIIMWLWDRDKEAWYSQGYMLISFRYEICLFLWVSYNWVIIHKWMVVI